MIHHVTILKTEIEFFPFYFILDAYFGHKYLNIYKYEF